MAIEAFQYDGSILNGWMSITNYEPTASITDLSIQNLGDEVCYLSLDQDWNKVFMQLAAKQMVSFEGLTVADLNRMYITNDGNGTYVGILAISR